MAATNLTPVGLTINDSADITAATKGDAIDDLTGEGNGHKIAYPKDGKLVILINNTTAGSKAATLKASDKYQAKSQGDLTITLAQNKMYALNAFESARFKHKDGYIYLEYAAGMTGTVVALKLP